MDNMGNICKKFAPKGNDIALCKIDVKEKRDVLFGYDFVNYKPKFFCIESIISYVINK